MSQPLQGQTAIVTGASAGLGYAIAMALAARGANIVATARRADRLEALCNAIRNQGGNAVFYAGDAAEEATAMQTIDLALKSFGSVDILINNAGAGNYKTLIETNVEEYDDLMRSNMRSGFVFSRHAAPLMIEQKRGVILFISSVAGLLAPAGEAVYAAAKFAQVGFAQSLDAELRKYGIKVGVIHPGGMKTEFAIGKGRTEEAIAQSRMMDAAEVAETIVFACTLPPNVRIPQMTVRHMG